MSQQSAWQIPCRDATGRERALTVRLDGPADDRVALALPAGESATLDRDEAIELLGAVSRVLGLMRHGSNG